MTQYLKKNFINLNHFESNNLKYNKAFSVNHFIITKSHNIIFPSFPYKKKKYNTVNKSNIKISHTYRT